MIVEKQLVHLVIYGLDGRSRATKVFDHYGDALRYSLGDEGRVLTRTVAPYSGNGRYRRPKPSKAKATT